MPDFPDLIQKLFAQLQNSRGWNAAVVALLTWSAFVIVTNLAWRIEHAPASRAAKNFQRIRAHPAAAATLQILRLGFYLGIPFAALYFGWIDLRSFGLGVMDWAEGARWAIVILLASWLLLMVIWFPYLRATLNVPPPPETQQTIARRFVELIYMQAHWAFYRAAAIVFFTGVLSDVMYWGSVLGLGMVCLEALLNPRVRSQLVRIGAADAVVWNMGQAFINTLAFLVTHNLFLLVIIQFLLEITVPHSRAPRPSSRIPRAAAARK